MSKHELKVNNSCMNKNKNAITIFLLLMGLFSCKNSINNNLQSSSEFSTINDTLFSNYYYKMPIYQSFKNNPNNNSYVFIINDAVVNCRIRFVIDKSPELKMLEELEYRINWYKRYKEGTKKSNNALNTPKGKLNFGEINLSLELRSPEEIEMDYRHDIRTMAQMEPVYAKIRNDVIKLGDLESIILEDFKLMNDSTLNDSLINSFVNLYKGKYGKPESNKINKIDSNTEISTFKWISGKKQITILVERGYSNTDKVILKDFKIEYSKIQVDSTKFNNINRSKSSISKQNSDDI